MANTIVKEYPSPSAGASYLNYVALLTQTYVSSTSGLLVVGKTYQIDTLVAGDDFANVGYVASSTPFIATGTTPTVWTNSTEVINITDSAPIATVFENTLGDTVEWTYVNEGVYFSNTLSVLDRTKTLVVITSNYGDANYTVQGYCSGSNAIEIYSFTISTGLGTNDILYNTPVEIRVYP